MVGLNGINSEVAHYKCCLMIYQELPNSFDTVRGSTAATLIVCAE
jgi:hypothetical protein